MFCCCFFFFFFVFFFFLFCFVFVLFCFVVVLLMLLLLLFCCCCFVVFCCCFVDVVVVCLFWVFLEVVKGQVGKLFLYPVTQKVAWYYVISPNRLSVRPSMLRFRTLNAKIKVE